MKKLRVYAARLLIAALLLVGVAIPTSASETDYAVYIVSLPGDLTEAANAITELGGELLLEYTNVLRGFAVRGDSGLYNKLLSLGIFENVWISRERGISACGEAVNVGLGAYGGDTLNTEQRGEGMVAAVLDSAFDVAHPAFALSDPASGRITPSTVEQILEKHVNVANYYRIHADESPYYSAKLPFVYDYYGSDGDVSGASSHGTHVAGILGANRAGDPEDGFDGVAPECQLLLMKVGDGSSHVSDYAIFSAFDDALSLGADVINMSFGVTSGFDTLELASVNYGYLFSTAEALGVEVVCASGNEGSLGAGSSYGLSLPLASNPDAGLLSEPASLGSTVAAASTDCAYTVGGALIVTEDGTEIAYSESDSPLSFTKELAGGEYELVAVGGTGSAADFAAVELDGRIALVSRGELSFEEKCRNALDAGAAAIIVYDNAGASEPPKMAVGGTMLPAASVTLADGERLSASARISVIYDTALRETGRGGTLSGFSSGGATPELALGVSLAAPGGGVRSTLPGGGYGVMSGTSMAAPYVSGALLLMKEKFGDDHPLERMMAAALPVMNDSGCETSPRMQGAGEVNLAAALENELLLSEDGAAKLELGEIDPEGFELTFSVTNTGASDAVVLLDATCATDGWTENGGKYFISGSSAVKGAVIRHDGGRNLNRYHPGGGNEELTIPAGKTVELTLSVSLSSAQRRELEGIFENGWFCEGYIYLDCGDFTLSIPYMGFAGDWDALPVIDATDYLGDEGFYPQYAITCVVEGYESAPVRLESEGGSVSISPDGNGMGDKLGFILNPLRNASEYGYMILDSEGELVCGNTDLGYLTKAYAADGGLDSTSLEWLWDGSAPDNPNYYYPDGEYSLVIFIKPRSSSESYQYVTLDFIIDRVKPRAEAVSVADGVLSVAASDDTCMPRVVAYNSDGWHAVGADGALEADVSGLEGVIYVELTDLALNTTVLRIEL